MNKIFSAYWLLSASFWYFGSGVLHDIFVINEHNGAYDRELLRLLMDGHVLMVSGIVMFVCYLMVSNKIQYGALAGIIISIAMLIYCVMIFPFLKSFGTIIVSNWAIIVCIRLYMSLSDGLRSVENSRMEAKA